MPRSSSSSQHRRRDNDSAHNSSVRPRREDPGRRRARRPDDQPRDSSRRPRREEHPRPRDLIRRSDEHRHQDSARRASGRGRGGSRSSTSRRRRGDFRSDENRRSKLARYSEPTCVVIHPDGTHTPVMTSGRSSFIHDPASPSAPVFPSCPQAIMYLQDVAYGRYPTRPPSSLSVDVLHSALRDLPWPEHVAQALASDTRPTDWRWLTWVLFTLQSPPPTPSAEDGA